MAENGNKPKQKDLKYWLAVAGGGFTILLTILEFFGITNFKDIFKENVSPYNTVIVLDGSAAMTEGVLPDGMLKFQAAKKALEKTNLGNEKIALRLFGGSCEGDTNTKLKLEFYQDNNMAKVVDAFQKRFDSRDARVAQGVEDQPTLTNAIIHAITGELAEESLKGTRKKMIVIAAGACPDRNVARDIAKALRDYDPDNEIGREIKLIGMGIEENQREIFRQIAMVTGKNAFFVDDQIDLEIALYNSDIADSFMVAKDNWLFQQGKDVKAMNQLTEIIVEGNSLSEIPSWAYEAMRLKAEILMAKTEPHNELEAIDLFGESAAGGNHEARWKLTLIILSEKVAKDEFPKTLEWLYESAQSGNPFSMYVLGKAYDEGTVWEKNLDKAHTQYTKAVTAFAKAANKVKGSAKKAKHEYGKARAVEAANRVQNLIDEEKLTINRP